MFWMVRPTARCVMTVWMNNNPAIYKDILIHWEELDLSLRAELLCELNPYACRVLYELLPVKSIQSHAVVAGFQIYTPIRFLAERSRCRFENMAQQPLGRTAYLYDA